MHPTVKFFTPTEDPRLMYCLDNIDNIKNTVRPKKTAHVYVPYNCGRKCPFCESRLMYDTMDTSLDKTLDVLKRIADSDIEDIMITGGEPCADLDALSRMLEVLKHKIVYVNTLFPSETASDIAKLFDEEYPCVKGINVSRHCNSYEKDAAFLYAPAEDSILGSLKVPVRINCVIQNKEASAEWVDSVVKRWETQYRRKSNLELHFREDFNKVTAENLHVQDSPFLKTLCENYRYHYYNMGTSFDDVSFLADSGMTVYYHKILPYSICKIGPLTILHEMVVFPDGDVCTDWNQSKEGLEQYCEWVNFKL